MLHTVLVSVADWNASLGQHEAGKCYSEKVHSPYAMHRSSTINRTAREHPRFHTYILLTHGTDPSWCG